MKTLQPAEWPKPRGFSHGVAVDGPGRWIVLAGQTGGDEKGERKADAGPKAEEGAPWGPEDRRLAARSARRSRPAETHGVSSEIDLHARTRLFRISSAAVLPLRIE